jgi:HD-GYP domain-containing protein (c-di-GMP phosphodiesterase class II)
MSDPGSQATLVQGGGSLQVQGRAFVNALHAAGQAMKLYPFENMVVQNALNEVQRATARIAEAEGVIELRVAGDFLFLNDARLRLDLSGYAAVSFVSGALARHGIGALEVDPHVRREEWGPFITLLQRPEAAEAPFEGFAQRLAAAPVPHIRVSQRLEHLDPPDDESLRQAAKRTYVQSVQVARELLTDVRLGKAVNVRRVKRAVQGIVDQVLGNETSLLGMTTLRDYDEYRFTHSVNVCIFSVVIGQRLGLSRLQLYELGLGALLHDIGKMRVSHELTMKPTALSPEEQQAMQQHPTEGLLALFSMHDIGDVPYRAMLIAYEHHMKIDLTGYPANRRPRQPTLFPRIVAIADGFDAATSKRAYQSLPWLPDAVFREMRDNPRRGFDPLLVKAFINAMGIYPVGTLAILDTYELAVVIAPHSDPGKLHHPIVKVITDPMGIPLTQPFTADLSEVDPATSQRRRTIIKTTDPEKYGIRIADHVAY